MGHAKTKRSDVVLAMVKDIFWVTSTNKDIKQGLGIIYRPYGYLCHICMLGYGRVNRTIQILKPMFLEFLLYQFENVLTMVMVIFRFFFILNKMVLEPNVSPHEQIIKDDDVKECISIE